MHSSQESYPETSKHFERIMKVSDALTADSDQGDFSFFKKNSDGSWHTALNVGGEWNKHPWNVLTSEQIQEMKSRLDIYLLSVTQFGQPHRTWKTIPIGLKCSLIPIAFAPSVGSLLCLEPESDLLFVVANNNDGVDVGTFNYCSSASDRLIVYATNTRFQSVLDFGACNDKNTLDEDRAISIQYISSLIDSAGIGTRIVQTKNEPPLWKQLRYSDVVGGGLLILLILYALARTIKRATQNASRDITFQGLDSAVTETKVHRPRIE